MFGESSRPLKIALVVLLAVLLVVLILVVLKQRGLVGDGQAPVTTNRTQSGTSTSPSGEVSGIEAPKLPEIKIERDSSAPPLLTPEEALKLRGIESSSVPVPLPSPSASTTPSGAVIEPPSAAAILPPRQ